MRNSLASNKLKRLENKLQKEDELRIVISRQLLGSLDERAILEKHSAEAKLYIKEHPELWDMTTPNVHVKLIRVIADSGGWNIEGHTCA